MSGGLQTAIGAGWVGRADYDVDVVMTTIGDGRTLDAFARSALAVADTQRVRLIVVADRRTPAALWSRCASVAERGIAVWAPELQDQARFLERLGAPTLLPWDSDNRRNLGFLLSYASGTPRMISVDDDNLPRGPEFYTDHAIVSRGRVEQPVVGSERGWFNACGLLDARPVGFYPRGFPYAHRDDAPITERTERVAVAVNEGLWTGDPDVDAVTRLTVRVNGDRLLRDGAVLDRGTWCPINSQNTALRRDAVPAYYFVRMGQPLNGLVVDRFGDIFSGYFVQACAKHLGDHVRFGSPLVLHERNPHVPLDDLRLEIAAILLNDDFCEWLTSCRLEGADYRAAYRCLAGQVETYATSVDRGRGRDAADFFLDIAARMRDWLRVIETLD